MGYRSGWREPEVANGWVDVANRMPAVGDHVVVMNGREVWTTRWRDALAGVGAAKRGYAWVTHWAPLAVLRLPYKLRVPDFDTDPGTFLDAGRAKRRREPADA